MDMWVVCSGEDVCFDQMFWSEVVGVECVDFVGFCQLFDGGEGVFEVCGGIECGIEVDDVDVFDVQVCQRIFDGMDQVD